MKAVNLREHTDEELRQMRDETKRSLAEMKVKSIIGEALEQPLLIRKYRRDIARLETVIRERTVGKEESGE